VEKALVLDPLHPEAWLTKAELLTRSGKHAEAEEAYDHIIDAVPFLAEQALGERGILRWRMGREDDARADFAAARAKATVAGAFNNLCYNKAVAGVALDLALEECEEAVRMEPDSSAIMDSHATVLLRLGRYQEAKERFDAALLKSPTISASHYGRALAKAALGDIESARADLAEARRLSPRIVENLSARGMPLPEGLTAQP
jgi:tetratricopeptide (TPR) repeat protein